MLIPAVLRSVGVKAGVLLCYLATLQSDSEGWSETPSSKLKDGTGLSYKQQALARRRLIKAGYTEEHYRRLEHVLTIRILTPIHITETI